MNWQKVVSGAAILSALVALITLSVTLFQLRGDYRKSQIREWQEVAVFSIIADAPVEGLSTNEIQAKYKTAAADLSSELPREEIQTQALRRTVLSLIAKHAVDIRNDGRFGIAVGPLPMSASDVEKHICSQKTGDFVRNTVARNPGQFTVDQLSDKAQTRVSCKLSDDDFRMLIGDLSGQNLIKIQPDGKVFSGPGGG